MWGYENQTVRALFVHLPVKDISHFAKSYLGGWVGGVGWGWGCTTMHEGDCKRGSQIPRPLRRGIWRTVRTSPCALWPQTPTNRLFTLLHHVVPLNDGNCRLIMPVVKGRCARDALPYTFDIDEFKSVYKHSTTIKHIYNKFANIPEDCNVAFDINDCWNFPISHKRPQWLAYNVWWYEITWRRAYVA